MLDEFTSDKESLHHYIEWWSTGASPQDAFTGCQTEGEEVTCIWEKYGECLLGFDALRFEITFTFQDHRIRGMFGSMVAEQQPEYAAAVDKVFAWLPENDPELGREFANATMAPDYPGRKSGELLVQICREYTEAVLEAPDQTPSSMDLIKAFEAAMNRGDTDAALDLFGTLMASDHFQPLFEPQLDIVVWAMRADSASQSSARARRVFKAAAERGLHLALATFPRSMLGRADSIFEWDEDEVACLRACTMKPEHRQWIPEIVSRLAAAIESAG